MSKLKLFDRKSDYSFKSQRETTPEGFLKVSGRVARSGIQYYYGVELGDTESPYKRFAVYRPADVVLSDKVCSMYNGVDVTNDHPHKFIDSTTYKEITAGVVLGSAYHDKEDDSFICCDMLIKDQEAINAVMAGKVQLSVGYTNTLEKESGVTPQGEAYDYKVSEISLINHVALVNQARAGSKARLFDEGVKMATIKINDKSFDVPDTIARAMQTEFDSLKNENAQLKAKSETTEKKLVDSVTENVQLKEQLKKAQENQFSEKMMDERLSKYRETMEQAKSIAGEKFVCDSYDLTEIKKKALKEAGVDCEGMEQSFIDGSFFAIYKSKKNEMNDSQKDLADSLKKQVNNEDSFTMDSVKQMFSDNWKHIKDFAKNQQ